MKNKIKTVTVIGANGTMGANLSGIFASFGEAKVYMAMRNLENATDAVRKACKSVRAESVLENLVPVSYDDLSDCISKSELVFESTSENPIVKRKINKLISDFADDDTILCSGTSGLSINDLSQSLPERLRKNYLGVHFFNPPYSMTLCEVIPSEHTSQMLVEDICGYLRHQLRRTVIVVKDTPAFMANRIGFQFINRAMQLADQYQDRGGIDYIDSILGPFSGRAMAPLFTADFVGLDVHKAIVDNIYNNTLDYAHKTFELPVYVQNLIDENLLGKKTGKGLYMRQLNDDGTTQTMVYDISTGKYRPRIKYQFPFSEEMNSFLKDGLYIQALKSLLYNKTEEAAICREMLLEYIAYSLFCIKNVGYDNMSADHAMAAGFNWCPPLALAEFFSTVIDLGSLFQKNDSYSKGQKTEILLLLQEQLKSSYDYRPFIRASR